MSLRDRNYASLRNQDNDGIEHYDQNLIDSEYNPEQRPPNLDLARKHGKAKRVYLARDAGRDNNVEEQELCPCCGFAVEGELIPLTTDLDKLDHVGVSYVLYFKTIKYLVAMLFIILFGSGFYNLFTNLTSTCEDYENGKSKCGFIFNSSSLADKRFKDEQIQAQDILDLITTLLLIIFAQHMIYQLFKSDAKAESETLKASDYTISAEDLPSEATEEQLVQWVEGLGTADQPVKVQRVIWPYMTDDNTKRCPVAFISFEQAAHVRHIQDVSDLALNSCDRDVQTRIDFLGKKVMLLKAWEPDDVLWENLGCKSRGCFILVKLGLIFVPFSCIAILNLHKSQNWNGLQDDSLMLQLFPIIMPALALIINAFLALPLAYLIRLERPYSSTTYFRKFFFIYALMSVINLVEAAYLADLLSHSDLDQSNFWDWASSLTSPVEFTENAYWTILVSALITPFLPLLDVSYLYKLYRRRFSKMSTLTQREAHSLFEGSAMNLPARYASIISMVCLACSYASILPIGIIFTIISLVLCYWTDKYLLLRRHQHPKSITFLIDLFLDYASHFYLIFSLGNIMYRAIIEYKLQTLFIGSLLTCLLSLFLLLSSLIQKIFPIKYQAASETKTFSQAKPYFTTDYDIENARFANATMMQQFT